MPPRFQRFVRTEGILSKAWCHIEKGYSIGLERGGFILSDRLLRTAGHCYLHLEYRFPHVVRINSSDKQTKQNSKRKERKRNENGVGEKFSVYRHDAPSF